MRQSTILLKLNETNIAKSEAAYENLERTLKSSAFDIIEKCKKELAAIDKQIDEARTEASKNIAIAEKLIEGK